jgi:predicted RNA-binding protein with PIN domain
LSDHVIIVDGYNLIHRTPALRPGPDRTLRQSREKLVNLLAWAFGHGDARFIVVFDGAELPGVNEREGRIDVRYSRPPRKADDDIRLIVEDQVERADRVTVVTADLEVARHARAMGAEVSISDLFIASALGPAAGAGSETEKPTQLSRKELEEWAEIFKRRKREDKPEE